MHHKIQEVFLYWSMDRMWAHSTSLLMEHGLDLIRLPSITVDVPAGASFQIINQGGGDQALNVDYLNFIDNDGGNTNEPCTGNDIPNATVSSTHESTQGANDGSITFSFGDTADRTNIEFSIDGGANLSIQCAR